MRNSWSCWLLSPEPNTRPRLSLATNADDAFSVSFGRSACSTYSEMQSDWESAKCHLAKHPVICEVWVQLYQ